MRAGARSRPERRPLRAAKGVFALTENGQARPRRARRRKRKLSRLSYALLFLTLVLAAAAIAASVLLKVDTLAVSGKTRYTAGQVEQASGIETGQNLLRVDTSSAALRIETALPYIKKAAVTLCPDGTVRIRVQEESPAYCFLENGAYLFTDEAFKVLETRGTAASGIPVVTGAKFSSALPGHAAAFEDAAKSAALASLREAVAASGLTVTAMDISNDYELSVVAEGRIKILLGTGMDLSSKLENAAGIIRLKLPKPNKGTLDASEENKRFPYTPGS